METKQYLTEIYEKAVLELAELHSSVITLAIQRRIKSLLRFIEHYENCQHTNIWRKPSGRPLYHALSDGTKTQMAKAHTGLKHAVGTKDKISAGLKFTRKTKRSVTDELKLNYKDHPEAVEWLERNKEILDTDRYIETDKFIDVVSNRYEIPMSVITENQDVVDIILEDGYGLSPEQAIMLQETIDELKESIDE